MKKSILFLTAFLCLVQGTRAQELPPYDRTRQNSVLDDRATWSRYFMGVPYGPTPGFPAFVPDSVKGGAIFYNTATNQETYFNGTSFVTINTDTTTYVKDFAAAGQKVNPNYNPGVSSYGVDFDFFGHATADDITIYSLQVESHATGGGHTGITYGGIYQKGYTLTNEIDGVTLFQSGITLRDFRLNADAAAGIEASFNFRDTLNNIFVSYFGRTHNATFNGSTDLGYTVGINGTLGVTGNFTLSGGLSIASNQLVSMGGYNVFAQSGTTTYMYTGPSGLQFVNSANTANIAMLSNTGNFSANSFTGPLTGNVTGNVTGTASGNEPILNGSGYVKKSGTTTSYISAIPNADLAFNTISGVSLGNNLYNLSVSGHITGSTYNGSAASTLGTDATTTATAGVLAARDANGDLYANSVISSGQTIATASATTILTVSSPYQTTFTGTSPQTSVLPVVSMLPNNWTRLINSTSTGTITINSSGGNSVQTLAQNSAALLQYNGTSGTGAASWTVIGYWGPGALGAYMPLAPSSNTNLALTTHQLNITEQNGYTDNFSVNGGVVEPAGGSTGLGVEIGKYVSGNTNTVLVGGGIGYGGGVAGQNSVYAGTYAGNVTYYLPAYSVVLGQKAYANVQHLWDDIVVGDSSMVWTSHQSVFGRPSVTMANIYGNDVFYKVPVAINATATITEAQFSNGYIKCTSVSAETLTLPTATSAATQLNATQGTVCFLTIDNTAGANTVTLALGTGFTLLNASSLTIGTGNTGLGTYKVTFVSSTAATISKIE